MKLFPRIKALQIYLVPIILITVILVPRFLRLGYYTIVDEPKYLKQSAGFYYAVSNGDYAKTNRIIHPGVIPMWFGAAAFTWQFPEYQELGEDRIGDLQFRMLLRQNDLSTTYMLASARLIMILAHTGLLAVAFFLAKRLVGQWPAFLATLLVAFDPFYFAHSRFLVTDGLLSVLMFVSLLAFLVFLKERQTRYLVLSAAAAAASWLTKVPGIVLVPTVAAFSMGEYWFVSRPEKTLIHWPGLKRLLGSLLLWIAIAVLVTFILWPALWVDASNTLGKIVDFTMAQSTAESISPSFFNGQEVKTGVFDAKTYSYYYPLTFLWRTTPIVLLGLLGLVIGIVTRQEWLRQNRGIIFSLVFYVILFTTMVTLSQKKFDRYLLPVFLPLDVLAALGWVTFGNWLADRFPSRTSQLLPQAALSLAIILQALPVVQTYPYYLSYYNPLMGGGAKAPEVMLVGWGEGLDQAGRYLNEKPQSHLLNVYTHYSFSLDYYFNGVSTKITLYLAPGWQMDRMLNSDYVVVYINHQLRGIYEPFFDLIGDFLPEHTIWIDGIEYARIYNMKEFRDGN